MVSLHPPFGDIPKKHKPGKWCHIGDWLVLDGHSVNNAICKEMCSLSYISVDDIAQTSAPTPEPTSDSPTSQSSTSPTHRSCRSGLKPPRPTLSRREPTDSWLHRELSRSNSPPEVCRPPDTLLRSKSPPGHFTSKYLASRGHFTSKSTVLPCSRLSPFVGGLFTSK